MITAVLLTDIDNYEKNTAIYYWKRVITILVTKSLGNKCQLLYTLLKYRGAKQERKLIYGPVLYLLTLKRYLYLRTVFSSFILMCAICIL